MSVRDERRGQIIAVARALVAEGGLEGLTIGAIEKRVPFTRGVITYHFADKDEIVGAVLESVVEEIDRATFAELHDVGTFPERIRAVLRSKVRGFLRHAEARACLVSYWSRVASDERARAMNQRLFASWRAQAVGLLGAAKKAGDARSDVDADAVAALLVGLVVGIVVQTAFDDSDVDRLVDEAASMVVAHCSMR